MTIAIYMRLYWKLSAHILSLDKGDLACQSCGSMLHRVVGCLAGAQSAVCARCGAAILKRRASPLTMPPLRTAQRRGAPLADRRDASRRPAGIRKAEVFAVPSAG